MKKNLILIIIPICFIFYSVYLRKVEGPYFEGFSDPSYIYLINSLNLSQINGYGVGHIDHPGTPVQVFGAVAVRIIYFLTGSKDTVSEDVLYKPELYLNYINALSAVLNSLGIFILGFTIFRLSKNYFLSLTFQLIPFLSINLLESFSEFKPENNVFFFIAVFLVTLINYVYKDNDSSDSYAMIFLSGLMIGIIISIKISFVCLAFIPLIIIKKLKNKIYYVSISLITFFICIIPALTNFDYIINWTKNLFIYNQRYGKGSPNVIDLDLFITNFLKIFINEKLFMFSFIMIIAFILLILINNNADYKSKIVIESKLLYAFFFAMVIQIFLVSKHYSSRYLYPALILTVPSIFLLIIILSKKYHFKQYEKKVYVILFTIMFLLSVNVSYKLINRSLNNNNEVNRINSFLIQSNSDSKVISSSDVSNEFTGLVLSNFYSGTKARNVYKGIIEKRFPNSVFFEIYNSQLITFPDTLDLKDYFTGSYKILYQTKNEMQNEKFILNLKSKININSIELKKVFSNNIGESLYEVIIK